MSPKLPLAAFLLGLAALAWVAAGYLPGQPLALLLLLPMAVAYLAGARELQRFQRDTQALGQALGSVAEAPPAELSAWLGQVPAALRQAVRLRVDGPRVGLPGPALTPYLVGLLVLLGMLGTFLGMVATLKGTGLALENAADVDAIRASLAAPVKGLGLAFGASVAGVATSAMLGLMSALLRRERLHQGQVLDALCATTLRGFSAARQAEREATEQAEQARQAQLASLALQREQAAAFLAELQALRTQWQAQAQAQQEHLLAAQARFHSEAGSAYQGLADQVGQALQASLAQAAHLAGQAIAPAVQATLAGLNEESQRQRQALASAVQQHLQGVASEVQQGTQQLLHGVAERLERSEALSAEAWRQGLAAQQAATQGLVQHSRDTLAAALAGFEQQARTQAQATLAEVQRLMQAAAEAPRAAAQAMAELRQALDASLQRDHAQLQERQQLLAGLATVLDGVNRASGEQRAAIEALVQAAGARLQQAAASFGHTVQAEATRLQGLASQLSSSAAQVAGLGEGFQAGVQQFGQASERLLGQLQRLEGALAQVMARSDDQLAYYVAQAREVVDLTLGTQKQIVDDLQQFARGKVAA